MSRSIVICAAQVGNWQPTVKLLMALDRGDLYKLFYADLRNSGIESDDIVGGMVGLVPVMTKESDLVKIKVT